MKKDEKSLATAMVYDNDARANIALGILRTNGIPSELVNEMAYNVMGIQLTPYDGIRLVVRREDLAQALELIKDV
ncbi:MAG: DUF2007 domain-containing protein [Clostridium sp.]|nr:DUF2007 domain-containing protein [Clostridium sp.]